MGPHPSHRSSVAAVTFTSSPGSKVSRIVNLLTLYLYPYFIYNTNISIYWKYYYYVLIVIYLFSPATLPASSIQPFPCGTVKILYTIFQTNEWMKSVKKGQIDSQFKERKNWKPSPEDKEVCWFLLTNSALLTWSFWFFFGDSCSSIQWKKW